MKRSLRIALLLTTGTLLRLVIALFILLFTVFTLYSQRTYFYDVLERTNTYNRLPLVILNTSSTQQLGQEEETQLGSDQFSEIILKSAPPEVAELASKNIVNAYYDWLEGDAASVQFTIDLSSSKDAIVSGIVSYAMNRYESLEMCTETVSGYDFFSVPCQIEGLNLEVQEETLREQLENTPILLRDTVYTQNNLLTDASGRSADEFAPWLQDIYRNRTTILLIVGLTLIVLVAINLFGATSWIKGVRRVGKLVFQGSSGFIITAVVLFILLPLFGFSIAGKPSDSAQLSWQNQSYDSLFNDIISVLARDFVARSLLFCIPFALIGAAGWLYGSYQLEKHRHTGASFASKLAKATLSNSGLVSSEPERTTKKKKQKKEHTYPIASSEIPSAKKKSRSNTPRKKKRQNKAK